VLGRTLRRLGARTLRVVTGQKTLAVPWKFPNVECGDAEFKTNLAGDIEKGKGTG